MEELQFKQHFPYFCCFASFTCCIVFFVELGANGGFQPFACPTTGRTGMPAYDDGTPCEPNVMLGPSISTMDQLGAKNDLAIFERGEWWRLIMCNWLHSGLFHLALNMGALYSLAVPLERVFGFGRTATLYLCSGIFGSIMSTIFLPGVISVGASGSVFGIVGAYWADIGLNYCARCDLKDTGYRGLLVGTITNMLVGLTPWVDNFMHVGGFLTGAAITTLLLPELRVSATVINPYDFDSHSKIPKKVKVTPLGKKRDSQIRQWHRLGDRVIGKGAGFSRAVDEALNEARVAAAIRIQAVVRGNLVRNGREPLAERLYRRLCGKLNPSQKAIVSTAAVVLAILVTGMLAAVASGSALASMRSCGFCKALNCVELDWFSGKPWWSCCMATLPGTCLLELGGSTLYGLCNVTGMPAFNASCSLLSDSRCVWDPTDPSSSSIMCQRLCFDC